MAIKNKAAIYIIIIGVLILAAEILIHSHGTISNALSIVALAVAVAGAFTKDSKIKPSYVILMVFIAIAFLVYPYFLRL
jgi:tetrahydromethanopterin S-methyltransferase subunit C